MRHLPFHIGREERDRWLGHMSAAVDVATAELDPTAEVAERTVADRAAPYFQRPAAEQLRNDTGLPISSARADRTADADERDTHCGPGSLGRWHVIAVRDLVKALRGGAGGRRARSTSPRARSTRCSGRTGPASRRRWRSSRGTARGRPGDVSVLGHDPARAGRGFRDRIGIVLQSSGVEHELTVREAVSIYGSLLLVAPPGRRGRRARRADAAARHSASATSRAGSGAASTSRSASPGTRRCCSSTSRRPASTRRPGARPGSSSATCARAAPPCC